MFFDSIEYNGKSWTSVVLSDGSRYAEVALGEALFDENGNYASLEAKFVDELICFFTDAVKEELDEAEFINSLIGEDPEYFNEKYNKDVVRRCCHCGAVMQSGFMNSDGSFHACCDQCLQDSYGQDEEVNLRMMREDLECDEVFYTEWDNPFYGM